MRIGSLFSGIGGLELGLELAGLGETAWQVEKDAYCRDVLAKHWPSAARYADVCSIGAATLAAVDVICGGFPCQDVSSAGKRAGLAGARSGLWFEYLRVVGELRPAWVVVENVASGAHAWVDTVVGGLGQLGYACFPVPLAAADVGAPHERARIFVVAAHADARREHALTEHAEMASASEATNAVREGCEGPRPNPHKGRPGPADRNWRSPQPDMVRVVYGVSRRLDSPRRRIAALGNAVVPQCAEVIGHLILELSA